MRHTLRHSLPLLAATTIAFQPPLAFALPAGGVVTAGSADITGDATSTTITQNSNRAIVDWNSFNVGANESVRFVQPSAGSIILNRVLDVNPSLIDGALNANGQVWLVNRNGMAFGPNAVVNVGGLLATTSDIQNTRFMSGDYRFDIPGDAAAEITHKGKLTVSDGGLAALVAPRVSNDGVITARLGTISLASGDAFTLDLFGDGLINLQASDDITAQLVEAKGTLQADGGTVLLTAAAAKNTVDSLINLQGLARAKTIGASKGRVVLNVGAKGTTLISGTVDASGTNAGESGGAVSVLGKRVGILSGAALDATGDAGGGTVLVGGDYQGLGLTPTAERSVVQAGAMINASATGNGNGGKVIVWADDRTDFGGFISARGGAAGGDGGFVETSGKQTLSATGLVDASSPWGAAGQWLLDPNNITIQTAGPDANVSGNPIFTTTDDSAIVTTGSIETALNAGTNVTITTGTANTNSQAGNITVSNAISKTAGTAATLTLNAANSIFVNSNIGSVAGALNILLNADSSGYGAIRVNGATLSTLGGNITLTGGLGYARGTAANILGIEINNSTLDAAGGTITLNGRGTDLSGNVAHGVYFSGSTVSTNGTGGISVTGYGGGNNTSVDDIGIVFLNTNTMSTVDGNISLTATGGNTVQWGYGMTLQNNTRVQATGNGNIIMSGTGGINGTTHSHYGVHLSVNNTYGVFTNNGDITITGQGTGGTSSTNNYGFFLQNGSIGSNGSGNVSVTGTGSNISTSSDNYGVYLTNSSSIYGTGGNVAVTGHGGMGQDSNYGVYVNGNATIGTTGNGTLSVIGTGGGTSNGLDNFGVYTDNNATFSTVNGDLSVSGTGGSGRATGYGIWMRGSSRIAASGTGDVTLTGAGGANSTSNSSSGVLLHASGGAQGVYTNSGNILINGTAGGTGTSFNNNGIYILNQTVGTTSGAITLNGTGSTVGTGVNNNGIRMEVGTITGGGGAVILNGTGGTGGNDSNGVVLYSSTNVTNTGSGTIAINGTGNPAASSTGNNGVRVSTGSVVSTVNGTNTITGAAGGGTNGAGVMVDAGFIRSSGSGVVTVRGTLNTAGESAIRTSGNGRIGSGTQTANIVLAANSITLDGTDVITTGNITFRPYADGATLGVGTGAGTAQISDTMIGRLNGGTLTFGDRATGAVTIDSARTYSQLATFMSAFGNNNITLTSALNSNLGAGNAFVIASGKNFVNNAGATPFVTGGARGLVYTINNSGNSLGAWAPDFTRYSSSYTGYAPGSVIESGNGLLVASSGNNSDTIRFTADAATKTYGNANPSFTYTFFCSTGCAQGASTTGAPTLSTSADANSPVSSYAISVTQNTLALRDGYEGFVFDFVAGSMGVTARPLTINVDNQTKAQGAAEPAFTGNFTGMTAYDIGLGTGFSYHPVLYLGSAGTYTIVADAVDPSSRLSNYSVTTHNGTYTVTSGSSSGAAASSGGGISQIINSITPPPVVSTSGGAVSSTSGGSYGSGSTGGGSSGGSSGGGESGNENGASGNGAAQGNGAGAQSSGDSGTSGSTSGGGNSGRESKDQKQQASPEMDDSMKALMARLRGFFQLSFAPSLPELLQIIQRDK